ncbi:MAG: hypothetical protein OK422_03810 [Thaumarchaeota archaeon]|nr:hypothetical protein [Nitrososphaerota archaeon]
MSGIKRRDSAEHVRKVTEEMVDDWVRRYQAGESLKQIAGTDVDHVTVFLHLKKRGLKLRDKVEAQIKAVTKYEKTPFEGDDVHRAYLVGFATGDLDVVKHGRAVRVRTSTTHPAMVSLFDSLFASSGRVKRYPREAKLTGYEWDLEVDLDASYEFMFDKNIVRRTYNRTIFMSYLAGVFDAEGSIYLHNKNASIAPELSIGNTNLELLETLRANLFQSSIFSSLTFQEKNVGSVGSIPGPIWRLRVWRFGDVVKLLTTLPLRHPEKISKKGLVLKMKRPLSSMINLETWKNWDALLDGIEHGRRAFIDQAKTEILAHSKQSRNQPILENRYIAVAHGYPKKNFMFRCRKLHYLSACTGQ